MHNNHDYFAIENKIYVLHKILQLGALVLSTGAKYEPDVILIGLHFFSLKRYKNFCTRLAPIHSNL